MTARPLSILLPAAAIILAAAGCVRRTVTINTDPQGAAVTLNDQLVGTSPLTVDFTWYGDYDVILRKEGYETLRTHHRLDTPWYELPGLDFISEALVPWTIHDQQEMSFALAAETPVDRDALMKNALDLRERTLFGTE
jgi:hypothetical protein